MKSLQSMTVRELLDTLADLLRGSRRADPVGDVIEETRAEERAKREAN